MVKKNRILKQVTYTEKSFSISCFFVKFAKGFSTTWNSQFLETLFFESVKDKIQAEI